MAVYKVPQDVEADDKLIGPFSFRQFIYLIIVAISMAGAWGLSRLFIPLAIIPLPIIIFFAALALPLRKDQPMEAYLSAVVSFYFLKSRKRFWIPDGIDSFVTIIPPKDADKILTKELDESEATRRLSYLADLVDTHGWAIRGAGSTPDTAMNQDIYYESQTAEDMFDKQSAKAQDLTKKLDQESDERKEEARAVMQAAAKEAPVAAVTTTATTAATAIEPPVSKLPPLAEIKAKQSVAQKAQEQDGRDAIAIAKALTEEANDAARSVSVAKSTTETPINTSVSAPKTDTMELTREQANEFSHIDNMKISSVAELAKHKAAENRALQDGDEVTISLR
ncbi:MAG: hypothetical protein QG549_808 [Patescibacteria group bacterium]|nr:hypothetical protein [Patescibacteria group bacterium]